jgi:hypothetical protein
MTTDTTNLGGRGIYLVGRRLARACCCIAQYLQPARTFSVAPATPPPPPETE